jgi:hypothetical protein
MKETEYSQIVDKSSHEFCPNKCKRTAANWSWSSHSKKIKTRMAINVNARQERTNKKNHKKNEETCT